MRTFLRTLAATAVALSLLGGSPAMAAPARPTIFLKVAGIAGGSAVRGHEGEIEIASYSFGATNSGSNSTGGGGGAGKVSLQDFHFTKHADVASPKLFQAVATGIHLTTAELTAPGVAIVFDQILVTSFQTGQSNADAAATENVSLNFAKITYRAGGAEFCWDAAANKAC